jgi:2-succinyl-5-enolpyruvyl-6-hydroxy-3-cyclohexene-1-carboxylate synthase
LVLLSADRPPRLRHWGANQTIDQTRLFGAFVREQHDPGLPRDDAAALKGVRALGLRAGSVSLAPSPGPVHLNLPFEEPLLPEGNCQPASELRPDGLPRMRLDAVPATAFDSALPEGRGLIVCGPSRFDADFGAALGRCARHLGLPVLADPLSGLRFGPDSAEFISGYDALLRDARLADALYPDWVLRFGRAPVSKRLGQWLSGIPSILVDPAGRWSDPNHDLVQRHCASPTAVCEALASSDASAVDPRWRDDWLAAERRTAERAIRHLADSPWCEGHIVRTLMARIPAGEALLCANSMPIRQLDTWSGTRVAPLTLFGNRGVSGIDGQLSTLAGLNHASLHDDIGPTWALLGDLSLCHDLSGLLQSARLRRPVVVINNHGGRIFDYLPQYGRPGFTELWRTPVDIDLGALAATFGLPHRLVQDAAGFDRALDDALQHGQTGQRIAGQLIEAVIDGDQSRRVHTQFWSRCEAG